MQETKIDGVSVLWEQGPAPLRATLTFGVGARDEQFRVLGITHLVEHLAMSALPRVHYEINASVDLTSTHFTACGRPEQVVEFLAAICRSLGDLPVGEMQREAGVLAAEDGHYAEPTVEALLHERFGGRGLGLTVYTGPGYDRLSDEQAREHVRRHFVADNAVLHLTGPPPPGLRLPLPAGPRPPRSHPPAPARGGPTWTEAMAPRVGVALLGRRDPAINLAMSILAERVEQAVRHRRGLSYDVDGEAVPLTGEEMLLALTVDARDGQEGTVAGLLWQELRRFAAEGPTPEGLAHEVAAAREMFADPRYVEVDLARAADALLLDVPHRPRAERLAVLARTTPEAVREAFAAALPTVQMVVPCGVRPELDGMGEGGCPRTRVEPAGRVFKPPLLAKLMAREARGRRLILLPDGLAHREPDGDVHVIGWSEVIGVERFEEERLVYGANGCVVDVDPDLFVGAEAAVAAVDANVPPALHYRRSGLIPQD